MGAIEQLITNNLDIWTSAFKKKSAMGRGNSKRIEIYGIKKLRELILELALRGLLVPQDSNEKSPEKSIAESIERRTMLIQRGEIKKSRSKKKIDDENFYSYPEKWGTARIEDLMQVINGRAYKKNEMLAEGTPILRVGNLFTSNEWYYSDLKLDPEKYIYDGDLIYAWSASFGPFIWKGGKVIYHYHIWKMDIFLADCLDKSFSKLFLEGISERIKASGNGIAMIHMTKERMEKVIHPVPPIEEQQRIVAKVDELMSLCDQLEQQTEDSLSAHQTLVETLLGALTNAADHESFQGAWQRIAKHFDILFTTEDSIEKLKQTILQLGVMGKLVPQDPADEPASELLIKIAAEKEQLVKDKKIKKQKSLPLIKEDEKPFELPRGWEWTRFFTVNTVRSELVPALKFPDAKQIAPDSIEKNSGKLISHRTVAEVGAKGPNNKFYSGQLLYSKIRPSLNKVIIAPYDGLCSADMYPIICHTNTQYILKVMLSEQFLVQVRAAENRVKMPKLNLDSLGSFLIPIPPEEEQKRIVIKIDKLMSICEQIKSGLTAAQNTQLQLADSITKQAVS